MQRLFCLTSWSNSISFRFVQTPCQFHSFIKASLNRNAVRFSSSETLQRAWQPVPAQKCQFSVKPLMQCVKKPWNQGKGRHGKFFSTRVNFNLNKNLPRDVLVYSHKNDNFYRILSYFGAFQMLIWGYVAVFSFQSLHSLPMEVKDTSGLPWWERLLYKEGQYKNALSAICLIVGLSILFITLTYPRRAVRSLWLLKGGDTVKITTYSWMGKTNTFEKPVEQLSCTEGRTGKGNHVPLKIKSKNFYFLLDKQGTFHNTELFDLVVGLERKL